MAVYAFMFAKQSPRGATFLPLTLATSLYVLGPAETQGRVSAMDAWHDWQFTYTPGDFVTEHDIHHEPGTPIYVLPCLDCVAWFKVISHADPIPFFNFVEACPPPKATTGSTKKSLRPQGRVSPELLLALPWLKRYEFDDRDTEPSLAAASFPSGLAVSGPHDLHVRRPDERTVLGWDEDAVSELFAELDARRDALSERRPVDLRDFTTEVRGSAWTMAHKHVAADCERGKAASREAQQWCRR